MTVKMKCKRCGSKQEIDNMREVPRPDIHPEAADLKCRVCGYDKFGKEEDILR